MGTPFLEAVRSSNQTARDFLAEQAQRYGVSESAIAGLLRGPGGVPTTRVRTSHAYKLQTAKGQVIGACNRAAVTQARQVDEEMEIEPNAVGEWADLVPQRVTEQSFTLARWDLYATVFERIFGTRELEMLTDQTRGFKIREIWQAPSTILNAQRSQYEYLNCWFERIGREVAADDDRVVRVNAQLKWIRRRRVA